MGLALKNILIVILLIDFFVVHWDFFDDFLLDNYFFLNDSINENLFDHRYLYIFDYLLNDYYFNWNFSNDHYFNGYLMNYFNFNGNFLNDDNFNRYLSNDYLLHRNFFANFNLIDHLHDIILDNRYLHIHNLSLRNRSLFKAFERLSNAKIWF